MPYTTRADLGGLLRALIQVKLEFVVVGGTAAVLYGAPTSTYDLDIVHRRTEENVDRFLAVLVALDAIVREPTARRLRPTKTILMGPGQLLMSTNLGPLDARGTLRNGRGFDELIGLTVQIGEGAAAMNGIDLDTSIELKLAAGRTNRKCSRGVLPRMT